jgi:hypothetical protein
VALLKSPTDLLRIRNKQNVCTSTFHEIQARKMTPKNQIKLIALSINKESWYDFNIQIEIYLGGTNRFCFVLWIVSKHRSEKQRLLLAQNFNSYSTYSTRKDLMLAVGVFESILDKNCQPQMMDDRRRGRILAESWDTPGAMSGGHDQCRTGDLVDDGSGRSTSIFGRKETLLK